MLCFLWVDISEHHYAYQQCRNSLKAMWGSKHTVIPMHIAMSDHGRFFLVRYLQFNIGPRRWPRHSDAGSDYCFLISNHSITNVTASLTAYEN